MKQLNEKINEQRKKIKKIRSFDLKFSCVLTLYFLLSMKMFFEIIRAKCFENYV